MHNFEPHVLAWLESKPSYVEFVRIPASFNSMARDHARAYYAAEQLGVVEEVMTPFFREIHINNNYLNSEDKLVEFFAQYGVSESDFLDAYNSFEVDTKLRQADSLVRRYQISGVPSVVINGKYKSGADRTGGFGRSDRIDERPRRARGEQPLVQSTPVISTGMPTTHYSPGHAELLRD